MKQIITLIIVCAALCGCHTTRQVPVVVEHATHDTLYINRLQFDSIYIDNWQLIEQRADTVFVEKAKMEYKYKFLRDTVRIHETDTIPVMHTIDVIKPEPYVPVAYKYLTIIGILALLLAGYRIYRKISLTLHL